MLATFICQLNLVKGCPVSWENIIAGRGCGRAFLKEVSIGFSRVSKAKGSRVGITQSTEGLNRTNIEKEELIPLPPASLLELGHLISCP